jgi:hypothetical protein
LTYHYYIIVTDGRFFCQVFEISLQLGLGAIPALVVFEGRGSGLEGDRSELSASGFGAFDLERTWFGCSNGQRFRIGDWVQTTLVPEAIRVLAWGNNPDEYVLGFMDEREFSMPLGNRELRISDRPRVKVQTAEILGVAEMP